ncbi:MAG: hypothetical protein JKY80_03465 [Mariprofundaceae bacterium]|nr:hypothetical protein [Mariprofundaceae bacterium]
MTDNRDIDEILASLDALLREGDSHHDDMPNKSTESTRNTGTLEDGLEANIESMKANLERLLKHNHTDDEPAIKAVLNKPENQQETRLSRVVLTEDMMVENPQVNLPLSFTAETLNENNRTEIEPTISEAPSLNDMIAGAVVQQGVTDDTPAMAKNELPNHVTHLHKQEVEQLLTRVSLDISKHLQQMLPKLIKESLHTHLIDIQQESDENNKISDDK